LSLTPLLGCSHAQPVASKPFKVYCPYPSPPELTALKTDAAVQKNVDQALDDLNIYFDYGGKLESALKCYEDALK